MYYGEGEEQMRKRNIKFKEIKPIRASVSFDSKQYEKIEEMALNKKVSVAWVVRDAIDQYLSTNYENTKQKVNNG